MIDLMDADYAEIIRFAEQHGYTRSAAAIAREAEEGSVGQYGLTLDEASAYIRKLKLDSSEEAR
jgi:hypothetical protein